MSFMWSSMMLGFGVVVFCCGVWCAGVVFGKKANTTL